jgi:hypothetical protein
MSDTTIPSHEIEPHPLSLRDQIGALFWWRGRLMREVPAEAESEFDALWASGLLQELQHRGWAPGCQLTGYRTESGGRVLEHAVVPFVTYPTEWPFAMLRDAGEHVLRVNALARSHGYELKDAHGYNVVFAGTRPQFVDVSSFQRRLPGAIGWMAERQFRAFFLTPLRIWSLSGPFMARRMLLGGEVITDFEADRLLSWLFRLLRPGMARRYQRARERLGMIYHVDDEVLVAKTGALLGRLLRTMRKRRCVPFHREPEDALGRALRRLRPAAVRTEWSGYQQNFRYAPPPQRLEQVVALIRQFSPETVLDVGSNEGEFSFRFESDTGARHVIALDGDSQAIDYLYERAKREARRITPVYSDAMQPLLPVAGFPQESRLQADVVVALAITHHLLLTQCFNVDCVLQRLASFARRNLVVEFMPKGLWNGKEAPPVPRWYTFDWFQAAFSRRCTEVEVVQLEENRVLFSGRVRSARP